MSLFIQYNTSEEEKKEEVGLKYKKMKKTV